MKIVAISDTHNKHLQLKKLPKGDMLIHAGDFTSGGAEHEVRSFLEWFSGQPHKYKVFIAGNHDWFFHRYPNKVDSVLAEYNQDGALHYLQDSMIEIEGHKIWGSPWTPRFYDWAFNADKDELSRKWKMIPSGVDIVITHGPMHGILDKAKRVFSRGEEKIEGYEHTGCKVLLNVLLKNVGPRLHICGHIHEAYGTEAVDGGITSINASILDERYRLINDPIVFNLKKNSY